MSLTVHVDIPSDDPAKAWEVAALIARTVEQHFDAEVDEGDMAVTTADWTKHVVDTEPEADWDGAL